MASTNLIVLLGRLGADPSESVSHLLNGNRVLSVGLAVNRPWKNKAGEYDTDWFRIKTFDDKKIDFMMEYLKKGNMVQVQGAMFSSKDQETNRVYWDVLLESIQNLTPKEKGSPKGVQPEDFQRYSEPSRSAPSQSNSNPNGEEVEKDPFYLEDDELPPF